MTTYRNVNLDVRLPMTLEEFRLTIDPESVDGNVEMCVGQFYEEYLRDFYGI